MVRQPLLHRDGGVALDELEFFLVRDRTEGLVNVEQFAENLFISRAGRVIANLAEPKVLLVD